MSEGMKSIIRKRLARAINSALNFKGMSAGSPKVMIEVSDAQNLLKILDAPVASAGVEMVSKQAAAQAALGAWAFATHVGHANEKWYEYVCQVAAERIRALPVEGQ